jgi:hypothetical protein
MDKEQSAAIRSSIEEALTALGAAWEVLDGVDSSKDHDGEVMEDLLDAVNERLDEVTQALTIIDGR